mgnify:CR=1 FL=1
MKIVTHSSLLLSLLLSPAAYAIELDTQTIAEVKWAVNSEDLTNQAVQLVVKPELSAYFDNGIKLTAIGKFNVETVDGLQAEDMDRDNYSDLSRSALLGDSVELELRELFFEKALGNNYLTLGKQQVVWGKADGLKVLDVVNPQSFREFILEDFDDSRIPLWTINYEWQINDDSTIQFLWIPDQSMHALSERQASYAFTTPRIVPSAPDGVAVQLNPVERPSKVISDSDIGLRWSAFIGGWDLTLNYLYHYDDLPVFYQRLEFSPSGATVFVDPKYERSHLLGGTFSNAFGNLTLRGELGYSTDKFFLTTIPTDSDGVVKSDEMSYVLGFDWFGFEDSLLSFQLFQSVVIDSPAGITRPEVDTTLTFLAQKDFLNETLKAEILVLQNMNESDGLIRPKITYEWQDDLKTWIGLDIFHGDKQGLFGQFGHNDRLVVGLEIGF